MQKIPTMFIRSEATPWLVSAIHAPGCEWVALGEGVATQKYDGSACAIMGGSLYRRFEQDVQSQKAPPPGALLAYESETKRSYWVPVGDGPGDRYHREAFEAQPPEDREDGTYELVGPKVQGNHEKFEGHRLIRHRDALVFQDVPRTFNGLRWWLSERDIEGLVFHHPDGRMAKIKLRDFGLKRTHAEEMGA